MNGGNGVYNQQSQSRRNNRHQQAGNNPISVNKVVNNNTDTQQSKQPETNGNGPSIASQPQAVTTNGLPNEQTQQPQQQTA